MPEWLKTALVAGPELHLAPLVLRLTASLALGLVVAMTYRGTRRPANIAASFPATLVLLCVLIAMVTQVIGDNVARAFSLVGALSIVRFRTVVRDTKDTAFVIYSVAVGMALGAGQLAVAMTGMAAVTAAAVLFRDAAVSTEFAAPSVVLVVRMALAPELDAHVREILSRHTTDLDLHSAATIRHGAALELTFRLRLNPTATLPAIVADLNQLDGIHTVEIRRDADTE